MIKFFARFAVATMLLTAAPLLAQDNSAVTGAVVDASGASVPAASVTLTNRRTGINLTQTTNNKGEYRFPNVPPQPGYVMTFGHAGFSTLEIKDVELNVGITRTQNATLQVGADATTVEVNAANSVVTINTTDASIGNSIDIDLLNDLPVSARNSPASLFVLQPGVVNSSVTGARTDQTSITVDGMDVNDISTGGFGTIVANIPVDAVQEFKATVAGLPTILGTGGGGQFQLVSKNGTNKFHGNINEYHRDTATVANLWFNNLSNTPRTPLIRNQFGGNLGGPILHDKLFFFADFYDSRIIQSITTTRTVPLDSYRAGNIGYVNNGNNGPGGAACTSTSRQNTTPGCISFLTPAQSLALDPAAKGNDQALFDLINARYPHANDLTLGDGVNTGLYRFTQPAPNLEYDGLARIDYNLNPKNRVFVQFHAAHRDSIQSQNRFGGDPVTRPFQDRSYGYVGSITSQIGNNKVNQFYYGDNIQVAFFALTFNPNGNNYISSFGPFTAPYDSGNIQRRRIPIPEVRDDFNWNKGTHNLQAGGTFKFVKTSNLLVNDYNFYTLGLGGATSTLNSTLRPANILTTTTTNTAQFDSAYAIALGRVASITSNYNYTNAGTVLPQQTGGVRRYRYYQTEAYLGDTWRATKNLTVTYGLRYQYYSVPFESAGAESVPSLGFNDYFAARVKQSASASTGITSVPFITYNLGGKANNAPDFFKPNTKDFAPRLALVYNPSFAPKSVFSVGGGVVFDRTIVNAINFIQNQSSFLFQNSVTQTYGTSASANTSLLQDPRYGASAATGAGGLGGGNYVLPAAPVATAITRPYTPYVNAAGTPTGLTGGNSINAVDPNLHDPYSIALNAGFQQELPARFVLKVNYDLRLGRRLLAQADASQLIEFVDPASNQPMSVAFGNAAVSLRNNSALNQSLAAAAVPVQPWFENVVTPGFYKGRTCGSLACASNTQFIAYNYAANTKLNDMADDLRSFALAGILPYNVGVASQVADTDYYTNKGSSNYNGLLVTVSKNMSYGIRFDLNYTWSHSVDNVSVVANTVASGTGFVCDALRPRACRGNSDFDSTNVVNGNFVVRLPVGRGRAFGSNIPWYLNEAIGGWSVSGIPQWQSGIAITTATNAFLAGYAVNDPAIFNGDRAAIAAHVHKNAAGQVALFDDKLAARAAAAFTGPVGFQYGSRNVLRGPSQFNMDAGLSKDFIILPNDRLTAVFRADFYNVLNHPTFTTLSNNITSSTFGTLSAQANSPRVGQFSLRLQF